MTEKFVGYFRLIDACERTGCPVCACLEEDSRRALDTLLYAHVTDAETRRRLREAWGFCSWHAGALLGGQAAATGAAILFEDLLRICHQRVERLCGRAPQRWHPLFWIRRGVPPLVADYHSRRPCPVCKSLDAAEQSYLEAVIDFAEDPQFARAYERSTGLCVPHVVYMVERCADGSGVDTIVQATLHKWQRLRRQLEGFVGKHEYRNAEAITEDEAMSWRLASEALAGRPGLFGNDMRDNAGERGANALAQRALADLRAENELLRAELAAARDEHTPRSRAG